MLIIDDRNKIVPLMYDPQYKHLRPIFITLYETGITNYDLSNILSKHDIDYIDTYDIEDVLNRL